MGKYKNGNYESYNVIYLFGDRPGVWSKPVGRRSFDSRENPYFSGKSDMKIK